MRAPEISCVISGSFTKAKPEIDRARECFEDYGITVLSPDRGGLLRPYPGSRWNKGVYPLLTERSISERQARQRHIQAIAQAHFLYVCAPEGYIGIHVSHELGFALGCGLPVYSDQPIDPRILDDSPGGIEVLEMIEVKSPEEVARHWQGLQVITRELWVPSWFTLQEKAKS